MEARLILNRLSQRLADKGIANPRLDANLILQMAMGIDERILMHHEIALSAAQQDKLEALMIKRLEGCPVSRLKGMREFYSLTFQIDNATLDPRPDSEILVEQAISHCQRQKQPIKLADFGTGSGCLLLSVLMHCETAQGIGLDIAEGAVKMAEKNAHAFGLSDRARFIISDWDAGLDEKDRFDVILSNPPYIAEADKQSLSIEVTAYDPHLALFAGKNGLDAYQRLMPLIAKRLASNGVAFVEIGRDQETDVTDIAEQAGLVLETQYQDLSRIIRCLKFRNNK